MVKVYWLPSLALLALIGGSCLTTYVKPLSLGYTLSFVWGLILGVIYAKITCRSNDGGI